MFIILITITIITIIKQERREGLNKRPQDPLMISLDVLV